MSKFHRMITYLYLYEQGIKSRNTGFAKIERRDQRCLLEIHMKNTGCSLSSVSVYFYVQKEARLAGIPLGNFSLTRGSGDFKTILDAENLSDSGYTLNDVKGIYIPLTEQMILVSQWDDDEFHLEDFINLTEIKNPPSLQAADVSTPDQSADSPAPVQNADKSTSDQSSNKSTLDQSTENPTPVQITENSTSDQSTENSISDQSTENSTSDQSTENPLSAQNAENPVSNQSADSPASNQSADTSTPNQSADTPVSAGETENSIPTDALKAVEALPRPARQTTDFYTLPGQKQSQTSEENHSPRHSLADEPENWDLRWRFILENYPVMTPFTGDEHTLCVRMELKDLRQLPKQFWYFGNNSFLLHGFFNYRYFILGMTEEFGVKKWFIGVPGVFQNPERVMAALFGFPEFRREKPSPVNTGQFGYWYCYLNELTKPSKK